MHKTLDYWSRDMLKFDFLEKGLGMFSPPHFVYDISRKMFLVLYILISEQISLSDCFYFLKFWAMYVLQLFVNQGVKL